MNWLYASRSTSLAILCLLWVGSATARAQAKDKVIKPDPQAVATAQGLLAMLDKANFTRAHQTLTARVKVGGPVAEQQWVAFLKTRRAPLGQVISRTLFRARFNTSIASGPDGNYEFLDYKTKFARKAQCLEVVTLTKETGHWEVSGYHIR